MRLIRSSFVLPLLVLFCLLTGAVFGSAAAGERQFSRQKLEQMQSERRYSYYLDDKAPEQHQNFIEYLMNRLFARIIPSPVLEVIIRWLPYIIIIAAAVLIALKIFGYNLSSPFRRQRKVQNTGFVFADSPPEAGGEALEAQWQEAMESHNYRLAIRLAYRIILGTLDQHQLIKWKPHKHIHSYLNELKGKPLYNDYQMAGKIFEYVWYGGFPASQQRCQQMQQLTERIKVKAKKSGKNNGKIIK